MNDAGRIGFLIKGEYSVSTTYEFLDVVYYQGNSYVAKKTTMGNEPNEQNEYWQIFAKGVGNAAVTGVKGEKEITYRRGDVNITPENIGALSASGDASDTMAEFSEPSSLTELVSGEKHNVSMGKLKLAVKNLIAVIKLLGTTDISAIGEGTVTGAVSDLNRRLSALNISTFVYNSEMNNGDEAIKEAILAAPVVNGGKFQVIIVKNNSSMNDLLVGYDVGELYRAYFKITYYGDGVSYYKYDNGTWTIKRPYAEQVMKTQVTARFDGSGTVTIPYPPGYTKDNCIVIPKFIFNSNEYYMNHITNAMEFIPQYVQMTGDKVTIHSNNQVVHNKSIVVYFIVI